MELESLIHTLYLINSAIISDKCKKMFSLPKTYAPDPQYKESTERNTIFENKVDKQINLLFAC